MKITIVIKSKHGDMLFRGSGDLTEHEYDKLCGKLHVLGIGGSWHPLPLTPVVDNIEKCLTGGAGTLRAHHRDD